MAHVRHKTIDAHASFHLYQIKLETEAALRHINKLVEYHNRSAGQYRRYQKERQK